MNPIVLGNERAEGGDLVVLKEAGGRVDQPPWNEAGHLDGVVGWLVEFYESPVHW